MSAAEAPKPVDVPATEHVEAAPAPVVASETSTTPAVAPATTEEPVKPAAETEAIVPVEEKKEEKKEEAKEEKVEKAAEPIYSGALGYKAPGLKNAFRYSKRYFWFGEEPVPSSNLREYLRGEKPEVAHPVVAWSSQTGKGLLFFVKHADQKENPAGALPLAHATDLVKDGFTAFTFKISGAKHAFEAQTGTERDGWFVAVEKGIADAKEAKDGIESSEGYKEHKDKLSKPTAAVVAAATAPKKSTDAAPKLAEGEAAEPSVAGPARTGSSSSSSADEDKKKKKSKSRSLSRGKRASIFGGLLGKKDKEPKEGEAAKATEAEAKKEEPAAAAPAAETSTAPVITTDIPKPSEELKTEGIDAPLAADPAPVAAATAAPVEEAKKEETPAKAAEEKPKPTKRGSIFGSFVEKLKSPREEKKEVDFPTTSPAIKEAEAAPEASKPAEEAQVAAPAADVPATETAATTEATTEPAVTKAEETKPAATGTPSKEKEHFSFGKFFGSKERAKSPAPGPRTEEKAAEAKTDAAPKIEDAPAVTPAAPEATPVEPTETAAAAAPAAPAVDTKTEDKAEEAKKDETPPTPKKRGSVFGQLARSLSKATGKKDKDAAKTAEKKEKLPETAEEAKTDAPAAAAADKPAEEAAADTTAAAPADAPVEKTIGDVPAEAVTVGEPKSAPAVAST